MYMGEMHGNKYYAYRTYLYKETDMPFVITACTTIASCLINPIMQLSEF